MFRRTLALLFMSMCALWGASAGALEIEALWTVEAGMMMEGAPAVGDLNGNGADEIVLAAYEAIIAFDGSGAELWRFPGRGRYQTCPAIWERGGEAPLIYAGDQSGLFSCLDGAGALVWQVEIGSVFSASPALAELGGRMAVVQGDKAGKVHAFDAATGEPLWNAEVAGESSSVAIGDLTGDGASEVVLATGAGELVALDAAGGPLWTFALGGATPDWATCAPILFRDSRGEMRVLAASSEERIVCLDSTGDLLWDRTTRGAVASTLSAGDFNDDGRADLFAVTQLGVLYRFDEDGVVLWELDTQGRSLAPGALVDLSGDGRLEYILCTQQGNLLVFDAEGAVVLDQQFPHRTINMTPAFGNFLPEREGLAFVVTGGESGRLRAFGVPAPVEARRDWASYRGDMRLTGTWRGGDAAEAARMTPENLAWDQVLTGEPAIFNVQQPGTSLLRAEAVCLRPDGTRQSARGWVAGASGVLQLPLSINAPGDYHFSWSLRREDGTLLVHDKKVVTLLPYRNDQALARRAVRTLELADKAGREWEASQVPYTSTAMARRAADAMPRGPSPAYLRESEAIAEEAEALAALQAAVPGAVREYIIEVNERTVALNKRAKRALRIAAAVDLTFGVDSPANLPYIVFEGDSWQSQAVDQDVPESGKYFTPERAITGERKAVSLRILNVSEETLLIPAEVSNYKKYAALYEVKPVPTNQGEQAWDTLIPLAPEGLEIPSLETRELLVDINLADMRPGRHAIQFILNPPSGVHVFSIRLDVLPFEMAPPSAMRLCAWATYNDEAVADLLAHGNTVFIASLPPATVAEESITLDFAALDEFLARLRGHDVYLLFSGIPSLGTEMESAEYVPRLAAYLDQLFAHLDAKGFDTDQVALYPHDEPGVHGWDTVNHYVAFARQGLKARPGLQFYVNGIGEHAMWEALDEVAAVWCPSFYMLAEDSPTMDLLRGSGKTLWSYDCFYKYARPIGPNTKTINIPAQYRLAPVHAFAFGATGVGYWSYNIGEPMWDDVEFEYPLVYVNPDGSITGSRRWRAVREGMEDARILIALRDKLDHPETPREARDAIETLLEEVRAMATQTLEEARLGVARYVLDASNNDQTVRQLRERMLDCVELLQ